MSGRPEPVDKQTQSHCQGGVESKITVSREMDKGSNVGQQRGNIIKTNLKVEK